MTRTKIISLILSIVMLIGLLPQGVLAEDTDKTRRTVYLHAQGEDPKETTNNSTVYMGENADIYFAIDNPNKGDYEDGVHKEPQYDLNGYTLRICFDDKYFEYAQSDTSAPIDYTIPDSNLGTTDKDDEELGEDTGTDVPQSVGYFVYRHGSGTYQMGATTYKTAYITVFYSGGYVPQKDDEQIWYNLAKLTLTPKRTGSTDVFIDIDSGDEQHALELFAKNQSDELSEQTFDFNAINGGYHHILIKDKSKPTAPVAVPTSGGYVDSVMVELTQEEGLPIYYTTDDSDPATNPARIPYTGPIEITLDTTIKTCAFRESDGKYSSTVSYSYTIIPDRPYLFDIGEKLMPDIYSSASSFDVLVSDKRDYGMIDVDKGNKVYYTFSNIEVPEFITGGTDAETEWVEVDPLNPVIHIDRKRIVRLVTDKMGVHSDVAWYSLGIKPAPAIADVPDGIYPSKIDVRLSSETSGATIYYTLDGSDPVSSITRNAYEDIPITVARDTTLRTVAYYNGEYSIKKSYYYLFSGTDDYGINAFYPPGVYDGSINVTLTANTPEYTIEYHTGDGKWQKYTDVIPVTEDTIIYARAVSEYNPDGTVKNAGEPYEFEYRIKPLPPVFAPESTQFTNAKTITIYTPESNQSNTDHYELRYTLDGSDPTTNPHYLTGDADSDSVVIEINEYTVVTAVVVRDGISYSTVVTHSYDIVKLKPVKPLTTLLPGSYTLGIGSEPYSTQFMPVPTGTKIYYTVSYDGGLCPDPIPNTDGTYLYDGTASIPVKGNTVIKAIAVNVFGVRSDIGIFSYTVAPEAPFAAPSATISGDSLPLVPVEAVKGSKVFYTVGDASQSFDNTDSERFYIDTETGISYRNPDRTEPLTSDTGVVNTSPVTLDIYSVLDSVESEHTVRRYALSDVDTVLAPPYASKETGMYEERIIDDDNNLLALRFYSLNEGADIYYRFGNDGTWELYTPDTDVLIAEDTILQLRCVRDGSTGSVESSVVSYVYNFRPLPPIIELASGTYLKSEELSTRIFLDDKAPTNKSYTIWYRGNSDDKDYEYDGRKRTIDHTMSFKAYVENTDTGRVSRNTIHYYIIESTADAEGTVYIADPYNVPRISAAVLDEGEYAQGIYLITPPDTQADIYYYYTYIRKSDGKEITTTTSMFDGTRPIIPTQLMDNITIHAYLKNGDDIIAGSDKTFFIDFVHLGIPTTSLEATGKTEFPKGTVYTLVGDTNDNTFIYYTLNGTDPTDVRNGDKILYDGGNLELNSGTTVKAAYYSSCGVGDNTCGACKDGRPQSCLYGVWGEVGEYRYTVPTTITVGGGGGGGGGYVVDKTRLYTKDIFGVEHPTHIGYINGYPDGTVRPEGDITRDEMVAILYRIMNHEYEAPFTVTAKVFPDVTLDLWAVKEIEYMADKNVVTGYPDGEFKPRRNLTRGEFAALIFRFTGVEKADIDNPYTDLKEDYWAYEEILALNKAGIMLGYDNKEFGAENNITRAEVMATVNRILGRKPLESYVKSLEYMPYHDLFENKWYYVDVQEATITHDYYLDKNGYEYKWENMK